MLTAEVTSRINRSATGGYFGELHIKFFLTDFHPLAAAIKVMAWDSIITALKSPTFCF